VTLEIKNQVESGNELPDLEMKMDSMGLLRRLKNWCTPAEPMTSSKNTNVMLHIDLMNLDQNRFQSIQDFRDQYHVMKKVCNLLELSFGRCEIDARAVLKKKEQQTLH